MRFVLDVEWPDNQPAATEALLAYADECAAEMGWDEPTTVPQALLAIVMAHGFDGLWERFGHTGSVAPGVFSGYVVEPFAEGT